MDKCLTSFLARLWAIWSGLVFVTTAFLVWVVLILFNHRKDNYGRTRFFQRVARVWIRTFFFFSGVRVRFWGKDHFDHHTPYVFVCNHRSFADIFLMTPFIPQVNKTIGKDAFMKIPLFRTIYGSATVLVNRKSAASKQKSYEEMKQAIQEGCSMCIYPEGTRNKTAEPLLPFQRGAFKLAVELGVPIVPVVIVGSDDAISAKHTLYVKPTRIDVFFLHPILPSRGKDEDEWRKEIYALMAQTYVEKRRLRG